jgi:hypothetical protein
VASSRTLPTSTRSITLVVGKVLYWTAVVAISIALVAALILFIESRDQSSVESGALLLVSFA